MLFRFIIKAILFRKHGSVKIEMIFTFLGSLANQTAEICVVHR